MKFRSIRSGVHILPAGPMTHTPAGIIIPEMAREAPTLGKVLGVGCDVKHVKVGDTVIFQKLEGHKITDPDTGVESIQFHSDAVLAVVDEPSGKQTSVVHSRGKRVVTR